MKCMKLFEDSSESYQPICPGWEFFLDILPDGLWNIIGKDINGNEVNVTGPNSIDTARKAEMLAIDKAINNKQSRSIFLYELFNGLLGRGAIKVVNKEFNNGAFGSWFIDTKSNRIIYDGRDGFLCLFQKDFVRYIEIANWESDRQSAFNILNLISSLK